MESPEEIEARQNAIRQYMEEIFAEEKKKAEDQKKIEEKNAINSAKNPKAPRRRGKYKKEEKEEKSASEEIKLLTFEEMFKDEDPYTLTDVYRNDRMSSIEPEPVKPKVIINPNYREKNKPDEPQVEAVIPKKLTRTERQAQWQKETDEYNQRMEKLVADVKQEEAEAQAKEEALSNQSEYNDSS